MLLLDYPSQKLRAGGTDLASDLDRELQDLANPAAGFPSAELVALAAGTFARQVIPSGLIDGGREGRDFLVAVAAGCIGVRVCDGERRARTEARLRLTRELARYNNDTGKYEIVVRKPSRVIKEWSRKSRANMTRALSELDYQPLFDRGLPAMLTLTYPGDWHAVAPSGRAVKAQVRALMRRWARAWDGFPPYLWKLEFQKRGAPHLHLFAVPPAGTRLCSCCLEYLEFRSWLSHQWADVVAAASCGTSCWARDEQGDRHTCCERGRHLLAGTGIDYREGARARDPKRLAVYFTKHGGAAGGKEYQHQVPVQWQTTDTGPGRFWGYSGLQRVRSETYLDQDSYYQLRRTLRRLSKSKGLTRRSRVPRVDTTTGEITWRTVTRRLSHLDHGGANGGYLLVNDGPALAVRLAGWLNDTGPPQRP